MALKSAFDGEQLRVPCPQCGHKIRESVQRLRRSPKLYCPSCRSHITVDARQFDTGIRKAEKSLENFAKELGGNHNTIKIRL